MVAADIQTVVAGPYAGPADDRQAEAQSRECGEYAVLPRWGLHESRRGRITSDNGYTCDASLNEASVLTS